MPAGIAVLIFSAEVVAGDTFKDEQLMVAAATRRRYLCPLLIRSVVRTGLSVRRPAAGVSCKAKAN